LPGGETDAAGLRTEPISRQPHSGGASAMAGPKPAVVDFSGETAVRQPLTLVAEEPAQAAGIPAAAVNKAPTAAPLAQNGGLSVQPPAAATREAMVQPVAPLPSGAPGQPRPAAPSADAVPAKAAARAGLEFGELPVGSGRSSGGIYDVLVQARQRPEPSTWLACLTATRLCRTNHGMNHLSCCKLRGAYTARMQR
jgi:hypothetical protein